MTEAHGGTRLLVEGCEAVVVMDDAGTEMPGGSILVEDGRVAWVGAGRPPHGLGDGAEVLDGAGCVALPGLVNVHHHLYQTLTRARASERNLFGWLTELYPVWAGLDADWVAIAAAAGLAELALSGCSTSTDHHYVFPPGRTGVLEAEIEAAQRIGLRFHPCRGSMDLGAASGGLPPDELVEDTDDALVATEEAVRRHHDPDPGSMLRIAVAPCSPFSVSERLMKESAELARSLGVRLHTHIAETRDEQEYCLRTFGRRPVHVLADLGWLGPDVWLAHAVHVDEADVALLAASGAAVAHCPTSNLRLGSGTAPVRRLLDAGVPVGLGVDGSASNDGGHLLGEGRQAMLTARGLGGPGALTPREALRLATRGGAACLGRDDVGSLEPGKRADVALFDVSGLAHAGADADPVGGLVFGWPQRVAHLLVEGRFVVRGGVLATADEAAVADEAHRAARRVAEGRPAGPTGGGA